MSEDTLHRLFCIHADLFAAHGSPFNAVLATRAAAELDDELRALFRPWAGLPIERIASEAVLLRFFSAAHDLALSGDDAALTEAFPPDGDADDAWLRLRAAIRRNPERFETFMSHALQTNEARRAAALLPGFGLVAQETGLPLICLEIGASAGLNQLWHRRRYDYGTHGAWGDPAAPITIRSEWRGPGGPPTQPICVSGFAGCDREPVDYRDPGDRRRLRSYLWPDQSDRLALLDLAIGQAAEAGVRVEAADAIEWLRLRGAPRAGAATVIYHSLFIQYVGVDTARALRAVIEELGEQATSEAPLAWLEMDPVVGTTSPIELRLTMWPGARTRVLAMVQAHGAWVDWLEPNAEAPIGVQ